jgi:hypothetical protein
MVVVAQVAAIDVILDVSIAPFQKFCDVLLGHAGAPAVDVAQESACT